MIYFTRCFLGRRKAFRDDYDFEYDDCPFGYDDDMLPFPRSILWGEGTAQQALKSIKRLSDHIDGYVMQLRVAYPGIKAACQRLSNRDKLLVMNAWQLRFVGNHLPDFQGTLYVHDSVPSAAVTMYKTKHAGVKVRRKTVVKRNLPNDDYVLDYHGAFDKPRTVFPTIWVTQPDGSKVLKPVYDKYT